MNKKKENGKNKTKNRKLIFFTIIISFCLLYKMLIVNKIGIEIYDKEFEEMMFNGVVNKVVCVKNKEKVNIFVKKEEVYEITS